MSRIILSGNAFHLLTELHMSLSRLPLVDRVSHHAWLTRRTFVSPYLMGKNAARSDLALLLPGRSVTYL